MSDWSGLERDVPVRLAGRDRCLHGHDLSIAGVSVGRSRYLELPTRTCNVCWSLQVEDATWAEVDPARHETVNSAPGDGLVLVRVPPDRRAGVGQIQLRVDGHPVGDVDVAVCGPCQRAMLEHVRVDESQRRRGYGRVLVAAAVTLMPGASWSTTMIDRNDPVAQSFWAAVPFPGTLGEPRWCTDMQRAAGTLPDW